MDEHHIFNFLKMQVWAVNKFTKSLYKLDSWVYMFELSKWACQGTVIVLVLLWYSMWFHYVCSGQCHNYFLQPGWAVQASALSIFLMSMVILNLYV